MSLPALDNLVRIGQLKAEPRNEAETKRMLAMARTRHHGTMCLGDRLDRRRGKAGRILIGTRLLTTPCSYVGVKSCAHCAVVSLKYGAMRAAFDALRGFHSRDFRNVLERVHVAAQTNGAGIHVVRQARPRLIGVVAAIFISKPLRAVI